MPSAELYSEYSRYMWFNSFIRCQNFTFDR